MLINRQKQLDVLCPRLREAGPISLDTEFIREGHYWPQLCLVQVYAGSGADTVEAVIDPFAVGIRPLLDLVSDETITKIVHAGGQDLGIFHQVFDCEAHHVFDTQIAAAFLGFGHQIGYADLVERLLRVPRPSKEAQFSDWAARPLSTTQMDYALADVRYLPALYEKLRAGLVAKGRLEWAKAEFRSAEARARAAPEWTDIYRKFSTAGLSRQQLAALRELAATRESVAYDEDRPPGSIVPDPALLQLAKYPPATVQALRSMRGMHRVSVDHAQELLAALNRAAKLPPGELPEVNSTEQQDPQVDAITGLLNVVAQVRAAEYDISRSYLAPRDQLLSLAGWWLRSTRGDKAEPPDIPLLRDWRRELLGAELLDLLEGRMALALDPVSHEDRKSVLRLLSLE